MTQTATITSTDKLPKNIKKGSAAYVLSWPDATYVGCSKNVRRRLQMHQHRKRKGYKQGELYNQDWSSVQLTVYYTSSFEQAEKLETSLAAEHHVNLLNMHKRWVQATKLENGQLITLCYPGCKIASKETGIDDSDIVGCLKGRGATAGGYKWKYL
jgi:predicted GIY-YIG superfamily endonuclease